MKIKCNVCERADAEVLCCADEAVLCRACDEKVHAANKLSLKHQRVSLLNHLASPSSSSSSDLPSCNNCKEKTGYLFCLEDRALLCKNCDLSMHKATPYASSHQRFLITGVKVALESSNKCNTNWSSGKLPSSSPISDYRSPLAPSNSAATAIEMESTSTSMNDCLATGPQWPLDEILGCSDFDCFEFSDAGSCRISSSHENIFL
ncbi:B-box-type zinc finger [Dillenia turbinata]|uniref:B-box-type zinc finger n=1 Tax=Dillenia turbinata TaxID=194707 RepID=A0AAN8ZGP0_9MAGN